MLVGGLISDYLKIILQSIQQLMPRDSFTLKVYADEYMFDQLFKAYQRLSSVQCLHIINC